MKIFDLSNFERQGNIEKDVQLESVDDIRQTIVQSSNNTLRSIKIFTPDLEPVIYNTNEFRESLLALTRGNRHAQIQILANDLNSTINNGHKLIQLAQQLTTAMTIKNTPEEYQTMNIGFILFDQTSFVFKPDQASHKAIYSECKSRASKLAEIFELAWEHAQQDPQTRRLSILSNLTFTTSGTHK